MGPFPVDRLVASYEQTVGSLSSPAPPGGVHEGYRQTQRLDAFGWVLDGFTPIRSAWLSVIEPGGYVLPHVDGSPYWERWQIPIIPAGRFVQAGQELEQVAGYPFRVSQWLPHEVVNDTTHARVHLVIDRDLQAVPDVASFQVFR